ncbi:flagellar biosynthesis protein FlgG [Azospirillum sp. TSO22-1]|uniref:flagellar biosynthesis protein FlgG n=1 Tax=Azospirillum sp. TSO22-1 TaxID=716789 RepID=UPI000D60EEA2|nr:flagellar biosynthesis protein FlgG [Azospirillum sp. TSO22-1]PWC42587.1 flagellar biosynthesis protein FlgG [Azospirillum sp. TSO22-1]
MDFNNIGVFRLAGARLEHLAQRQRLIAENVVNANTPDYRAKDVKPFEALLGGMKPVAAARTSSAHLASTRPADIVRETRRPELWEVTPDGNAVALEQEMTKGSETRDAFALTAGLFQRNVQMLRAAWKA